jgi:hypothetical protein
MRESLRIRWIIFTVLVVVPAVIVLYVFRDFFTERTPETILKSVFDISLKDFDYSVELYESQKSFGDGKLLLVIKFNKLTQENIDYLKEFNPQPLPITGTEYQQLIYSRIPKRFLKADTGYYLYRPVKITGWEVEGEKIEDASDFDIFIIDTKNKLAVLYYQYG